MLGDLADEVFGLIACDLKKLRAEVEQLRTEVTTLRGLKGGKVTNIGAIDRIRASVA